MYEEEGVIQMLKVLSAFKIIWKIFIQNKMLMILFFVSIFYNVYFFYSYLFSSFEPGEALVRSSFTVQGGILATIVIGIQLSRLEERTKFSEVLSTIYNGFLFSTLGKILFFVNLIFIYVLINMCVLLTMFKISEIPFSIFYLKSINYLVLYWMLSFLIGGVIGFLLSQWIKGKMIYFISLIVWLLISPLNYPFIIQLGIILDLPNTFELVDLLNIGQNNPHYRYHSFYGFSLETYQWLKRVYFLLILIVMTVVTLVIKGVKRGINSFILIMLLCVLFAINPFNEKSQILHFDREADAIAKKDSVYYQNTGLKNIYNNNFEVTKYDVDLSVNKHLSVNAKIDLKNTSKTAYANLHFLLYHDLLIESIVDKNGRKLKFKQDGDNVFLELGKSIFPNETNNFTFKYGGISSPFFFANEQAMYLPNHYPWLPTVSKYNTSMIDFGFQAFRLPLQPKNEIFYTINFDNNLKVYTNLQKVSSNKWEGKSTEGVYLISGSLDDTMINGENVVYPLTWDRILGGYSEFSTDMQSIIDLANEELGLNKTIQLKRIMFLEQSLNSDFPEQHMWIHNNTMIISPSQYFINDEIGLSINKNYLTYALIPALTWKSDGIVSDRMNELQLFDYSYAYFINLRKEGKKSDDESSEYYELYIGELEFTSEDPENLKLAKKIKDFLTNERIDQNQKINFFKNWYKEIKKNQKIDYQNILKEG